MNPSELIIRIYHSWNDLHQFYASLSADQLTRPTDAGGWSVKDHLIHLAAWASSVDALLSGQSCRERMGIPETLWNADDTDAINALIQQRERDTPLPDALATLKTVHQRVVAHLQTITDETLRQPLVGINLASWDGRTYEDWIVSNTYEHYDEHLPWMDRIARQEL